VLDLASGESRLVSPGVGLTTCAWIHPTQDLVMFSSTHEDPNALAKQAEEIAIRESGIERAYGWDYDRNYDIYVANGDGSNLINLSNADGYDAEGSYSADGTKILFASNRQAYSRTLSQAEQALFEDDSSYFMDLYVMNADGSDVTQLTRSPGYDGGPFYSPDGSKITWRRFNPDGNSAEIWTMDADGSNQRQLTADGMVAWAPYYHPSGAVPDLFEQPARACELRAVYCRYRRSARAGESDQYRRHRYPAGVLPRRATSWPGVPLAQQTGLRSCTSPTGTMSRRCHF
jgi:hypothetical protein